MSPRARSPLARPTRCLNCGAPNEEGHICDGAVVMAGQVKEKDFQKAVVRQARAWGWRVHYTTISYRSQPGWPDLFMVRGDRLLAVELKTMKGKVSDEQEAWLAVLEATGKVETEVWRPDSWERIGEVLR